jgi:hypothetical protein
LRLMAEAVPRNPRVRSPRVEAGSGIAVRFCEFMAPTKDKDGFAPWPDSVSRPITILSRVPPTGIPKSSKLIFATFRLNPPADSPVSLLRYDLVNPPIVRDNLNVSGIPNSNKARSSPTPLTSKLSSKPNSTNAPLLKEKA